MLAATGMSPFTAQLTAQGNILTSHVPRPLCYEVSVVSLMMVHLVTMVTSNKHSKLHNHFGHVFTLSYDSHEFFLK